MRRDSYPVLMRILVATAVIGLAVQYNSFYLFHAILGIVLLRSLLVAGPGTLLGRNDLRSKYHLFFGFMLLWFALGLTWSWDPPATLRYLGYIVVGGSLSVLIVKYIGTSRSRFEDLFSAARNLFFVDMGIGLLEAFTPFRLPVSPFSPSSAHWEKLADYSPEQIATLAQCPTGFHWNPNNYGCVMIILLPFFLLHRRWAVRIVGTLLIGTLVYFAGSRGCMAAMAFLLFLAPVYRGSKARWLGASLILAVCSCAYLNGALQTLDRLENPTARALTSTLEAARMYVSPEEPEGASSVGVRRALIANGLEALHHTRGLGVGGGAASSVQRQHARELDGIEAMHNFWIELLVNGGYLFFLPFVVWYGRLAHELLRHGRRFRADSRLGYYSSALSLALVGFIPGGISPSTAIYILPLYILFGLAIAMVNVCRYQLAAEVAKRAVDRGMPTVARRAGFLCQMPGRSSARGRFDAAHAAPSSARAARVRQGSIHAKTFHARGRRRLFRSEGG